MYAANYGTDKVIQAACVWTYTRDIQNHQSCLVLELNEFDFAENSEAQQQAKQS